MKTLIYFFIIFSLYFYLFQCDDIEEIKDYQIKNFYLKTNETKNFTYNAINYFSYYLKSYLNIITRKISNSNSSIILYGYTNPKSLFPSFVWNLKGILDQIFQIEGSVKTLYYLVFKSYSKNTKEENNFISFQVFNKYSFTDISNSHFKFDTFQINTKKSYIFTFSFITNNKNYYLDYNVNSNIEYFNIMDINRKVLVSYKNSKTESISLRKYINKGTKHFFISLELNDNSFSFDIKVSDKKTILTICLCVIIPLVIIIIIIIIVFRKHLKINKRKSGNENSLERNNNDFKNEENNCTYEYTPLEENRNNIATDNPNERYLYKNQYSSSDNNQEDKDLNNSNNNYPAPYCVNKANEEENFSLFTNSETKY